MTRMREQAVEILQDIPDDKIAYAIEMLKGLRLLYIQKTKPAVQTATPTFGSSLGSNAQPPPPPQLDLPRATTELSSPGNPSTNPTPAAQTTHPTHEFALLSLCHCHPQTPARIGLRVRGRTRDVLPTVFASPRSGLYLPVLRVGQETASPFVSPVEHPAQQARRARQRFPPAD